MGYCGILIRTHKVSRFPVLRDEEEELEEEVTCSHSRSQYVVGGRMEPHTLCSLLISPRSGLAKRTSPVRGMVHICTVQTRSHQPPKAFKR